jgi:hypothetical protein
MSRSPQARQRSTVPGPPMYAAASATYDEASHPAHVHLAAVSVDAPDGLQLTGDRVGVEHDHPTTNAISST